MVRYMGRYFVWNLMKHILSLKAGTLKETCCSKTSQWHVAVACTVVRTCMLHIPARYCTCICHCNTSLIWKEIKTYQHLYMYLQQVLITNFHLSLEYVHVRTCTYMYLLTVYSVMSLKDCNLQEIITVSHHYTCTHRPFFQTFPKLNLIHIVNVYSM